MKTLKINCFSIVLIFGMLVSCVELTDYSDPKDSEAPAPVSNVQVENLNGGAKITYTLPSDKDLLGAKVSYSLTPEGEMLEKYASVDTIELEGFGDTNEHLVTVYAVDKSGNVSEGVMETIKPLIPPVELIRETLIAGSTFGGITLSWKNTEHKDMGVSLFIPDPVDGEWTLFDTYFSNSVNGEVIFRPFEAVNQQFRIEMFDRWQNNAQPLEVSLTPLAEILLP
ncbi:MAG: DUF4959 domain-containing protein, partial [Prevotellaceae bacterium]|nr:DUF4959 domain-containing protein [Prevotellaceae bacterium]